MSFLIEATVKPSNLQAFAQRPALAQSKCGFENGIKNTFFIRSVSVYRELLVAAVFVVTIVQHRTSVLDKTACMCSKTCRADNTKSVHNRPKPTVFVRTAQGLSSNQNEVAINSKSDLWRTALLIELHGVNYVILELQSSEGGIADQEGDFEGGLIDHEGDFEGGLIDHKGDTIAGNITCSSSRWGKRHLTLILCCLVTSLNFCTSVQR